jgi:hypothetical protein
VNPLTKDERKQLAEALRAEIEEAENLTERIPYQYFWLRQGISNLIDKIEIGSFPI